MEFLLHAKLRKPDGMSHKEFFGAWKQETVAVKAARDAGAIKQVWKVPGRYEVIAIVEIADTAQIDPITHGLPFFKLGYDYACDFTWTMLGSYDEWATQVAELARG